MSATLEYAGHTLITFDDQSYRWFSVKRFTWDGAGDGAAVLAALIGHRRYRDHYASRNSHDQDAGDIHGPYLLGAISPSAFLPVGAAAAESLIEEFCALYDPPRPEIRKQIAASILSWLERSSWYRLRALPHAVHEWGFVLREFRELAAISGATGEVLSVVMAVD